MCEAISVITIPITGEIVFFGKKTRRSIVAGKYHETENLTMDSRLNMLDSHSLLSHDYARRNGGKDMIDKVNKYEVNPVTLTLTADTLSWGDDDAQKTDADRVRAWAKRQNFDGWIIKNLTVSGYDGAHLAIGLDVRGYCHVENLPLLTKLELPEKVTGNCRVENLPLLTKLELPKSTGNCWVVQYPLIKE